MNDGHVRLDRAGPVATITVDRPAARNALTTAMKHELLEICSRLRLDRDLRVVAVRGAGGTSFASGADVKEMSAIDSVEGMRVQARLVEDLYDAIEAIPVPTVAVIEGYALGSGMFLALACDLRICTPAARLGAPATGTLGNCLAPGEYRRLINAIGPVRTKELLLGAVVLTAAQALAWGLVTEVVEANALEDDLAARLAQLAGRAPLAMSAAKEAVRRLLTDTAADLDDIVTRVLGSDDFLEGRAAFVDKRSPVWRNR